MVKDETISVIHEILDDIVSSMIQNTEEGSPNHPRPASPDLLQGWKLIS